MSKETSTQPDFPHKQTNKNLTLFLTFQEPPVLRAALAVEAVGGRSLQDGHPGPLRQGLPRQGTEAVFQP